MVRLVAGLVQCLGRRAFTSVDRVTGSRGGEAHCVGLANRLCAELCLAPSDSAIVSIPAADAADALRKVGIRASGRAPATRLEFLMAGADRLEDTVRRKAC